MTGVSTALFQKIQRHDRWSMYQASSEVATLVVNTISIGVHRDPQQHVAHGKTAQDKGKRQRIKRSCRQPGEHQQDQQHRKVRSEREQQADHGECSGTDQKNTPRAEQAAEVDRERANEHQAALNAVLIHEASSKPRCKIPAQVGQPDTDQPSGAGGDHGAEQNTEHPEHRVRGDDRCGAGGVGDGWRWRAECSRRRALLRRALARSMNRHHGGEAGPQPALQRVSRIEHDLDRDTLHHLGEVSRRVIRRQKRELRSAGRGDLSYFSVQHDPGKGIDGDIGDDRLSGCW